jgi:hypothetical protein
MIVTVRIERLYLAAGWTRAGTIPEYERSAGGALDASSFYYRLLEPEGTP